MTGVTGDYGSFQALNGKNGWSGMSTSNQFVFMSNSTGAEVGIWNDQDNEWIVKGFRNAQTELYYNGSKSLKQARTVF